MNPQGEREVGSSDFFVARRDFGLNQSFIDRMNAEMDRRGVDVIGINHRHKRYFVANCFRQQPKLRSFLFSDMMADICRATLGYNSYLFWEQYVVKGGEEGMKFGWHQDSGYIGYPDHKPYLTCWCALDDRLANTGVNLSPIVCCGNERLRRRSCLLKRLAGRRSASLMPHL